MHKKEMGIYIHVPFCKRKCTYCDFISYPDKFEKANLYFDVLNRELDSYDFKEYNITTIYIGGGTPSFVDSKHICSILEKIKSKINNMDYKDAEITIEINPGTVTEEKLLMYKKAGVNRLSIGLQSSNDFLLNQMGRIHTYSDFLNTYMLAKKLGFQNVNVDLMLGLPNQTIQDLNKTLEEIFKLNPNHVSVYSLIVEEGTKLEKQIERGELKLPDEELERQMYWYVKNKLELNGYSHYEVSNFAKKGWESKHNLNCWEQKEYIGLGVAAHSYLNDKRYSNTSNLEDYISTKLQENIWINETELIKKEIRTIEEVQTLEDKKNEYMLLGFRKIEGINIAKFKEKFVDNPIFLFRDKLNKLVEEGLIEIDLNNIKLTSKGIDFANLVFEEFVC